MSTNPIVDYHIIYALALIALAVTYAGHTWGLGRLWAKLPFVHRNRWLSDPPSGQVRGHQHQGRAGGHKT